MPSSQADGYKAMAEGAYVVGIMNRTQGVEVMAVPCRVLSAQEVKLLHHTSRNIRAAYALIVLRRYDRAA